MARRQIKLTEMQARILAILIIALSVGFVSFTLATFFLVKSRSSVRIEIVEMPPPKIELPAEQSSPATITEYSTPQIYMVEEFDYKELIVQATEMVEKGEIFSVYLLQSEDALKVIRGSNLPFLICQTLDGFYTVAIVGEYTLKDVTPMRTIYGVLVLSVVNKDSALERALALRSAGYPAYLMHFTRDGRDWYSVVVGAFNDVNSAEDYSQKLNWEEIMKIAGTNRPGYVGRVAP
ncbi:MULTISPECIES: SPOR domain-containing protein [Pseudothermotoga]|uniref:SPOR domain-containing protein n=1 Tax=Pseudothermotoga TaxID=1643951 RepID=UPI000748758A|nr:MULTISPECIES: SPOR domain-containing protein [Pseudothermotoga]KUK21386.1 MAG: Sporulation domain protein [Pseudothermotoga lettingae]MDK2884655.1 hypothetical protein [Pseudothermotoga sp.]